jgi:hypothetical protein
MGGFHGCFHTLKESQSDIQKNKNLIEEEELAQIFICFFPD